MLSALDQVIANKGDRPLLKEGVKLLAALEAHLNVTAKAVTGPTATLALKRGATALQRAAPSLNALGIHV